VTPAPTNANARKELLPVELAPSFFEITGDVKEL